MLRADHFRFWGYFLGFGGTSFRSEAIIAEEDDDLFEESSSEEDQEAKEKYKNAAYWTLPDNVR